MKNEVWVDVPGYETYNKALTKFTSDEEFYNNNIKQLPAKLRRKYLLE